MHTYINRKIEPAVKNGLKDFPVVAILGPRQCGKSTLAKKIISSRRKSLYLDLELESDLRKIEDPELFLTQHIERAYILLPVDEEYPLKKNVIVTPLHYFRSLISRK